MVLMLFWNWGTLPRSLHFPRLITSSATAFPKLVSRHRCSRLVTSSLLLAIILLYSTERDRLFDLLRAYYMGFKALAVKWTNDTGPVGPNCNDEIWGTGAVTRDMGKGPSS